MIGPNSGLYCHVDNETWLMCTFQIQLCSRILVFWSRSPGAKQPLFPSPAEWHVIQGSEHTLHCLNLQHLTLGGCCQKQSKHCNKESTSDQCPYKDCCAITFPNVLADIWHPHITSDSNRNACFHVGRLSARLYKEGQCCCSSFADGEVEKQDLKWLVQNLTTN